MGEIVKNHRGLILGVSGLVLLGLLLIYTMKPKAPKQSDPTEAEPVQELVAADETEQPRKPVADKSLRFLVEPAETVEVSTPESFEKPAENVPNQNKPENDQNAKQDVVAVVEQPFTIQPELTLESEIIAPPVVQNDFTVPKPPVVVSDPPVTIRPLPPDTPLFEEAAPVKAPEPKVEEPTVADVEPEAVPQAAPRLAPQIVVQNIYPASPMPPMFAMMPPPPVQPMVLMTPPMRVVTMVPVAPMPYRVVTVHRWTMPVLIYPNGVVVPQTRGYAPGFFAVFP